MLDLWFVDNLHRSTYLNSDTKKPLNFSLTMSN